MVCRFACAVNFPAILYNYFCPSTSYRLIFYRNWGRLKNPQRKLIAGLLMTSATFLAVKLLRGKKLPAGHNF
jgi:hypothetical protein